MILEFRCKNYKSILDELVFSMLATKNNDKEESLLVNNTTRALPLSTIYGANGSGKTNVIKAISYLNYLVSNSNKIEPGDKILTFPHKLSENKDTSISIQFICNGVRYAYGFILNEEKIVQEYLYHFKNNRQANIFERSNNSYNFGKSYKSSLNEIESKYGKINKLFLPIAAVWSNFNDITEVFDYLKNNIVINTSFNNQSWLNYTLQSIKQNDSNKTAFITFLNSFGINLDDLEISIVEEEIKYDDLPQELPEEAKIFLSTGKSVKKDVKLIYNNIQLDLNEESRGIQKLFEIGGPILDVLSNGYTLIYDELETSLHPLIVENIIKLFMDPNCNKNNAQLIFTTHDTNLLNLSLIRKDQIYFVEKNSSLSSSTLYSLSDLKNIRKDENIESGYIKGKYGAIPFLINSSFNNWGK
ncbi:MAG: ATP-binding protein [Clostridium sp.]|nr:ATP-binding protein [Clostridium sp.]